MSDIIASFHAWEVVLDNLDLRLDGSMTAEDQARIRLAISGLRETMARYPVFFTTFDYSWALDERSYRNPLECRLQCMLLSILPEISSGHPNYPKLGGIAVRMVATAELSCASMIHDGFKYILVNTSFLKTINAFLIANYKIAALGQGVEDARNPIRTNHFGGRDTAAALLTRFAECLPFLDEFVATVSAYCDYRMPLRQTDTLTALLRIDPSDATTLSREQLLWIARYDAVEAFVLCHELAHLLEHSFSREHRTHGEEIEADYHAASLYFIVQSRVLTHAPLAIMNGPATFFHLATIFTLIRSVNGTARKSVDQEILEAERQSILTRAWSYPGLLAMYGLVPRPETAGADYWAIASEVGALSAACIARIGQAVKAEFEYVDFLNPRYFDGHHPDLVKHSLSLVRTALHRGDLRGARSRLEAIRHLRETLLTVDAQTECGPELANGYAAVAAGIRDGGSLDGADALLQVAASILGSAIDMSAPVLTQFALQARACGDLQRARDLLRSAIAIRRSVGPIAQASFSDDLMSLALVERDAGDYPTARALAAESLAVEEVAGGPDSQRLGYKFGLAATIESACDNWTGAVDLLRRAVELDERAIVAGTLDLGLPLLATKYRALHEAHLKLNDIERARDALGRLVDVLSAQRAVDNAALAAAAYRLATLEWQLGNRNATLDRMHAAATAYALVIDGDPLELANYCREQGTIEYALGRIDQACGSLRRAVAAIEASPVRAEEPSKMAGSQEEAEPGTPQEMALSHCFRVVKLIIENHPEHLEARAVLETVLEVFAKLRRS
jgi:tetratricopeptide (TPR) repeat protein